MRKPVLAVAGLALAACHAPVAPETPCDPRATPKDSTAIVFASADSAPVLKVYWCGPITVE